MVRPPSDHVTAYNDYKVSRGRHKPVVFLLLIAILAVGSYLRYEAATKTVVQAPLRSDALQYFMGAYNLSNYGVFSTDIEGYISNGREKPVPNSYRLPGYPIFLLPFIEGHYKLDFYSNKEMSDYPIFAEMSVAGKKSALVVDRITGAQAVLGSVAVLVIYLLCSTFLSPPAALFVTALAAISPHLVNMNIYVLTESLFSFLVLASVCMFAKGSKQWGPKWFFYGGLFLGGACLVRPTLLYFPIILALVSFLSIPKKSVVRLVTMAVLGFALIYSPWVMRNVYTLGSASSQFPAQMFVHHGMYPSFKVEGSSDWSGAAYRNDPAAEKVGESVVSVLTELKRRFTEEPYIHFKWFLVGKPLTLWSWSYLQGVADTLIYPVESTPYERHPLFISTREVMRVLHIPLMIAGFLGAFLAFTPERYTPMSVGNRFTVRLIGSMLLFVTLLHMVGAPYPRYATPFKPLAYIMAAFFITMAWRRLEACQTQGDYGATTASGATTSLTNP